MEDIVNSIKAALYDRTSSPFFALFLSAWVIWNFETILFFFSDLPPSQKIFEIHQLHKFNSKWNILFNQTYAYPAYSALAFSLIYQFPAYVVNYISLIANKINLNTRIRILNETPMEPEEASKLRNRHDELIRSMDNLRKTYESQLQIRDDEISRLNSKTDNNDYTSDGGEEDELIGKRNKFESLSSEQKNAEVSGEELVVFDSIAKTQTSTRLTTIQKETNIEPAFVKHYVNTLTDKGLVKLNGNLIALSSKGIDLYVSMKNKNKQDTSR